MRHPQLNVTRHPLKADDWLKAIEKKLLFALCTKREKVPFAAHQLYGPAIDWWDAYSASHLDAETITWTEFKDTFRAHFVPAGLIEPKKQGFCDLTQSNMSVVECLNRLSYLPRHAPEEVNTDYTSFQKLVDKAIIIEAKQAEMERDGKRKLQLTGQQSNANTWPHLMRPQSPFYRSPNTIRPPMPPQHHQFQMQRPNSQFQP
jgi:hypothetical protein